MWDVKTKKKKEKKKNTENKFHQPEKGGLQNCTRSRKRHCEQDTMRRVYTNKYAPTLLHILTCSSHQSTLHEFRSNGRQASKITIQFSNTYARPHSTPLTPSRKWTTSHVSRNRPKQKIKKNKKEKEKRKSETLMQF